MFSFFYSPGLAAGLMKITTIHTIFLLRFSLYSEWPLRFITSIDNSKTLINLTNNMNLQKFKSLFTLLVFAIIGYASHKVIFHFWVPKTYEDSFIYTVELLYLFFFFFSSMLILVLDKVKQKSINSVGYTFLLLTTIKMAIAYVFLKPILAANLEKTPTEKMSFFIISCLL